MARPNGEDGPFGASFSGANFSGSEFKYADSIICTDESAQSSEYGGQTFAHEIGHILLNRGKDDHVNGKVGVNQVNLMASPGWQVNGSVTDSSRITAKQAEDILSKRPSLLSNP